MNKLIFTLLLTIFSFNAHAVIQINQFLNESTLTFKGQEQRLVVEKNTVFETVEGDYKIILEDAGHSGYHRPHWKFNVWLQSKNNFPLLKQNSILYAVIFYDGLGNVDLHINKEGELSIIAGHDVKKILYPWATATIGRGNPYHNIGKRQADNNGVVYFDHYGFVGYSDNYVLDDQCESFDNHQPPFEINAPLL